MRQSAAALLCGLLALSAAGASAAPSGGAAEGYGSCLLRSFLDGLGWRPTAREGVFTAPGGGQGTSYVRVPNLERADGPALWVETPGFRCVGGGAGFTVFEGPSDKSLALRDVLSGALLKDFPATSVERS